MQALSHIDAQLRPEKALGMFGGWGVFGECLGLLKAPRMFGESLGGFPAWFSPCPLALGVLGDAARRMVLNHAELI